jgi:hypothetical protein
MLTNHLSALLCDRPCFYKAHSNGAGSARAGLSRDGRNRDSITETLVGSLHLRAGLQIVASMQATDDTVARVRKVRFHREGR